MNTLAIVLHAPGGLSLERVALRRPAMTTWLCVRNSAASAQARTSSNRTSAGVPRNGLSARPRYEMVGRCRSGSAGGNPWGHAFSFPARLATRTCADCWRRYANVVAPASRVVRIDESLGDEPYSSRWPHRATCARRRGRPRARPHRRAWRARRLLARIALAMGRAAPVVWKKIPIAATARSANGHRSGRR